MIEQVTRYLATGAVLSLGLYYVFPAWDQLVCAHYARAEKLPIWPLVGIGAFVTFALGAIWS